MERKSLVKNAQITITKTVIGQFLMLSHRLMIYDGDLLKNTYGKTRILPIQLTQGVSNAINKGAVAKKTVSLLMFIALEM